MLTIGVIVIVYNFFDAHIVRPVNDGVKTVLIKTPVGRDILDSVFAIDVERPEYQNDRGGVGTDAVRKTLDERYPVTFLQIQESAEMTGHCHLSPASDFTGNHLIFPFLPDISLFC